MSANTDGVRCTFCGQDSMEDWVLSLVCAKCGYAWGPVAKPLDPPAPTVPRLLHRTVVAQLTAERDAARQELEGAKVKHREDAQQIVDLRNERDAARREGQARGYAKGYDAGVASGRAAAVVEAVDMVEHNFAHGDRVSEDTGKTARWIVEQIKRIKP